MHISGPHGLRNPHLGDFRWLGLTPEGTASHRPSVPATSALWLNAQGAAACSRGFLISGARAQHVALHVRGAAALAQGGHTAVIARPCGGV